MLVKPAPGRAIRDPGTMQLVSETDGLEVDPTDLFWARVLGERDVIDTAPINATEIKAAPAPLAEPASSASPADVAPEASDTPAPPEPSGSPAPTQPQGDA